MLIFALAREGHRLEAGEDSTRGRRMNRFRVALIGTSFGRLVQAVAFSRHPGFELVALAGRDPEKTRRLASEAGIAGAYADWREMLERESPDLVSIVTPVDLHHPMMMAALERGAHVLSEKPTALHRFQAAEMRDAARARGRVAAINHEFRFQPARQTALELVKRGAIGAPRRASILGRYPIWPRGESRPMTWLSDRARGGGILGALGSHHTDCLRLFFGEPIRALASVRVGQPRRGSGEGEKVATADDSCTVHYAFESGATALIDLDATAFDRWERYEVLGEEAALRWDDDGDLLWRIAPGKDPEAVEVPARFRLARREGEPRLVAPFEILLGRLHRAMSGGEAMSPDFDDAVAVQCALDAARTSSEAGTRVAVDVIPPRAAPAPLAAAAGAAV